MTTKVLTLSLAMSRNPRTAALLDGKVDTQGFELVSSELRAPDIFWRQLRFAEFDISEMSLSSLLMVVASGDRRWVALPVFHDRRFFQAFALVRPGSGIDSPGDLRGKHVGVPDYQQTAALWTRAVLSEHFDVEPSAMTWHMERVPALSHGGAVGFQSPPGVEIVQIPESASVGSMMIDGSLDAAIVYEPALLQGPTLSDRSPQTLPPSAARWLFQDRPAEARRSFEAFGFVPANHCVVVRRTLVEQHPWLAVNIYEAFLQSKRLNDRSLGLGLELYGQLGLAGAYQDGTPEPDLFPYGYQANQRMLRVLCEQSYQQGLTPRLMDAAEIMADQCLSL